MSVRLKKSPCFILPASFTGKLNKCAAETQSCLQGRDLPFLRVLSWAGVPLPSLGLRRKDGRGSLIKAIKSNIVMECSYQHCFWDWASPNSHSDARADLTRCVK